VNITKTYVHPQEHTIINAMEEARQAKTRHTVKIGENEEVLSADAIN